MHQFKHIIGSLPRHVPSNPVAANTSGYQPEGLFRSGRRYLRPANPKPVRSATFTEDARNHCRLTNDDEIQAYLHGNPKVTLFHNRNSSFDRVGDIDICFQDLNNTCDNKKKAKNQSLKNNAPNDDKAKSREGSSNPEARTYAKIITDYSKAYEKKNTGKGKEPSRGLFPKLPFEAVVSSLTKLDYTKFNKGRVISFNASTTNANQQNKDSNHVLANSNVNNEKFKPAPDIKDMQKRDSTIKNSKSNKTLKIDDESKDLTSRIMKVREKQPKLEKSKNCLTITNNSHKNFNFICDSNKTENKKENFTVNWIKRTVSNSKIRPINNPNNNFISSRLNKSVNNWNKFNVCTSEDRIEIQIPISTEKYNSSNLQSNVSILNLQISAKMQEKQRKNFNFLNSQTMLYHRDSNAKIAKSPKSTTVAKHNQLLSKPVTADTSSQPQKSHSKLTQTNKTLPWWISPRSSKNESKLSLKPATSINESYPPSPVIKVLNSEETSPDDNNDLQRKKLSMDLEESRQNFLTGQRTRRRKKMTNISKITRHLEAELQEKKKEINAKKASIEALAKKPQTDSVTILPKPEKQVTSSSGALVNESKVDKKKVMEAKEDIDKIFVNRRQKSTENKSDQKNPKFAQSLYKKANSAIKANVSNKNSTYIDTRSLNRAGDSKSKIAVLQKTMQTINKNSNNSEQERTNSSIVTETLENYKKENVIDHRVYKMKKISDVMKPIEKRKDGTLIDYGLKVPTRKPRQKKPEEKSTNIPNNSEDSPKKTILAPQQYSKDDFSLKKPYAPSKITERLEKRISQTISELPLNETSKMSRVNDRLASQSKPKPAINEKAQRNPTTDKTLENTGGTPDSGKLSYMGGPFKKNNTGGRGSSARITENLTNKIDGRLKSLKSEQTFNGKTNVREKINLPVAVDANDENKSDVDGTESKVNSESEKSEKEIIYSAWLNRFHTRKHTVFIK